MHANDAPWPQRPGDSMSPSSQVHLIFNEPLILHLTKQILLVLPLPLSSVYQPLSSVHQHLSSVHQPLSTHASSPSHVFPGPPGRKEELNKPGFLRLGLQMEDVNLLDSEVFLGPWTWEPERSSPIRIIIDAPSGQVLMTSRSVHT